MGRKPRADRTPEEKWHIVQEGMKSGNVSETCGDMASLRRCTTVGRMKRNKGRRQRSGARAQRARKPRRTAASDSWNELSDVNRWRSKS